MILNKQLTGVWGILAAVAAVAMLTWLELSFIQWRVLIVSGLLGTVIMLYHKRLRHFVLLPSAVVFSSGLLLIVMNCR